MARGVDNIWARPRGAHHVEGCREPIPGFIGQPYTKSGLGFSTGVIADSYANVHVARHVINTDVSARCHGVMIGDIRVSVAIDIAMEDVDLPYPYDKVLFLNKSVGGVTMWKMSELQAQVSGARKSPTPVVASNRSSNTPIDQTTALVPHIEVPVPLSQD